MKVYSILLVNPVHEFGDFLMDRFLSILDSDKNYGKLRMAKSNKAAKSYFLCAILLIFLGCEGGLEPPQPAPPSGAIEGFVEYIGKWPSPDSLFDLRFVAFKTPPQSPADFFDLSNLVFSNRLTYYVDDDQFFIEDVDNDTYRYNVIAHQYGQVVTANWRPVGLYRSNNGIFTVRGDTIQISITVDFSDLPPFPPE